MKLIFLNTKNDNPEPNRQILMKQGEDFYTVGFDEVENEFFCASQGSGWDMARLDEYPDGINYAYLD